PGYVLLTSTASSSVSCVSMAYLCLSGLLLGCELFAVLLKARRVDDLSGEQDRLGGSSGEFRLLAIQESKGGLDRCPALAVRVLGHGCGLLALGDQVEFDRVAVEADDHQVSAASRGGGTRCALDVVAVCCVDGVEVRVGGQQILTGLIGGF